MNCEHGGGDDARGDVNAGSLNREFGLLMLPFLFMVRSMG